MRLHEKPLGFIINFLLGIAWAFTLIGAVTSFLFTYQSNSLFEAIMSAIIGTLPGIISVLLLELIITFKEKQYEEQKQTQLLEKILENLQKQK